MACIILKSYKEVEPYIELAQKAADKNRKALGFLPASAYEEAALQGRLWIAVLPESNDFLGHLIYGGRFPYIKVYQVFVQKHYRKTGVGTKLIKELSDYGEIKSFLSITAKVAADLKANTFYKKSGFSFIRQVKGGNTKDRQINVLIKELNTPSLFGHLQSKDPQISSSIDHIRYINQPISSTPSYVIDLNVFFDVVKKRARSTVAKSILSAGFNNHIHLCVTVEFVKELERHSNKDIPDPVLSFSQSLPTLPGISEKDLRPLFSELRPHVFPNKSISDITENDKSDLVHLASCIHHKVYGFITSDKAILQASESLREHFGLDIISPSNLIDSTFSDNSSNFDIKAVFQGSVINVTKTRESEREEIERFLIKRSLSQNRISHIWAPGVTTYSRSRFSVRVDNKLVGFASWDVHTKLNKHME